MDLKVLMETADFAAKKHKDQRRKNAAKTPYINHPIGNCDYAHVHLIFFYLIH